MVGRSTSVLISVALLGVVLVAGGRAMSRAAETGSPERGRAVYFGPGGCSNCHAASADPTQPSAGPPLTLEMLGVHAAAAGKPLADYVAESILVPAAYAPPGYVRGTMQPPRGLTDRQIDDLVSYLIGKPWTRPDGRGPTLPARPIATCDASRACRATVARWVKAERLPDSAVPGAKVAAVAGCLSCHRYAGSGIRIGSAPDLTSAGRGKATAASFSRRLRCPACVQKGTAMPSYAALGDVNLRRVAEFLRASLGVRG